MCIVCERMLNKQLSRSAGLLYICRHSSPRGFSICYLSSDSSDNSCVDQNQKGFKFEKMKRKFEARALSSLVKFDKYSLVPHKRHSIMIDENFFNSGFIHPSSIILVQGSEGSGKSFFLSYLLASTLVRNPGKRVLHIETTNKFCMSNLCKILSQLDTKIRLEDNNDPMTSYETCDVLKSYLDRVIFVRCLNAEDFIFTIGPAGTSSIRKLLLAQRDVSLVSIDSIDTFSFCECLKDRSTSDFPDLMKLIKMSVHETSTPVIACSNAFLGFSSNSRKTAVDFFPESSKSNIILQSIFTHSIFLEKSKHQCNEFRATVSSQPMSFRNQKSKVEISFTIKSGMLMIPK